MLNSYQFIAKCKEYPAMDIDITGLLNDIKEMNKSQDWDFLNWNYNYADRRLHGMFMYFLALHDSEMTRYCTHLNNVLYRIKSKNIRRLNTNFISKGM